MYITQLALAAYDLQRQQQALALRLALANSCLRMPGPDLDEYNVTSGSLRTRQRWSGTRERPLKLLKA